jgi:hypothetical protein
MTVRDMLTALQTLPRDAELLAFEAGCEDYCEQLLDGLDEVHTQIVAEVLRRLQD